MFSHGQNWFKEVTFFSNPEHHTITNCACYHLWQLRTAVWMIHPRMEESSTGREIGQAAGSSITATLATGLWVTEILHADFIPVGFTSGTIQPHCAKVTQTQQRYSLAHSPHLNDWELPWKGNLPPHIWKKCVILQGAQKHLRTPRREAAFIPLNTSVEDCAMRSRVSFVPMS